MLTYMRNRSKTWVKWIIFGAIIVVFVFWGGSTYWSKEANMVAKVDRHIITAQQYSKAYEDTLRALQENLGTAPTPDMIKSLGLKEKVLDQMVDDYILSLEARKAGVTISDEELQSIIQSFPPFQQDGKFSEGNYRRVLEYQRLTPAEFEDMQRKELLKQKFFGILTENMIVTPEEVMAYYKYQNDVFDLNFLAVDARQFMKDVTVNDRDAGIFFDKNKEKYKVPPRITLSCLLFPSSAYLDKAVITQEEAREYYDSHKKEFAAGGKVSGRHILLALPKDADPALVERKMAEARKIYEEAKGGADFAALAKERSEDAGTKDSGGDLGAVVPESLPAPVKEAFDKMKPGEVAGPVRTSFGIHVLKLEGREEAKQSTFEEVAATVMQSMKARRALILAGDDADASFRELYELGTQNIASYAQKKGLQVKDVGPFFQGADIGIPNAEEFTKAAFLLPKGEMGRPVDTGDGFLIYLVKDKMNSRIPELSEVKDRVLKDLAMSKALEKAKAYAASLEKDPARLGSMPFQTTGAFKRTSPAVPRLESVPGVKDDLNRLRSPRTYAAGEKLFVVWIGKMQPADVRTADPAQVKDLSDELLNRKKETAITQYQKDARKNHSVTINTDKVSPRDLSHLPDNN